MQIAARLFRALFLGAILLLTFAPAHAQDQAENIIIPNFWDKHERFGKPDLSLLPRLRFLTTTDFPPFNFIDRKKRLSGFHVDLAREICRELGILLRCQIQALPWEQLVPEIEKGDAEVLVAGLAVTAEARKKLSFTRRYLHIPARFVVRRETEMGSSAYEGIFRKETGIIEGSAHEAYFQSVFSTRNYRKFKSRDAAFTALKAGEIDAVFSDALSLSFWLSSQASADCCRFLDGAFISREFFGSGMALAVAKDKPELVEALNFALAQINAKGKFAELYLRYFPLGLF